MNKQKIVLHYLSADPDKEIYPILDQWNARDAFSIVNLMGDEEEFYQEAKDADGLCVWLPMSDEEYARLENCKLIVAPAIGIDPFDLEAATRAGIGIANVPDYCVEEVAVHTIALLLSCIRRIPILNNEVKNGIWNEMSPGPIGRISGRTYGLVSFGKIPQQIAKRMQNFGVRMVAYDPFAPDDIFAAYGVDRMASLEELFSVSDYVSVHTPYSQATRHMIGEKQFNCAKNGSILIATSRGGVVDEDALFKALQSGKIASAGMDVIEDEKNHTSPLFSLPNVIATPHVAYAAEEASQEIRTKILEQLVHTLRDGTVPRYLVNRQVLGHARFEKK